MLVDKLWKLYRELKSKGLLSVENEDSILREIESCREHYLETDNGIWMPDNKLYSMDDCNTLQHFHKPKQDYFTALKSLEDLLDRDKQRVNDGYKPKIKIKHLVKPGRGKSKEIIIIPDVEEEKFMHDKKPVSPDGEATPTSGTGDEEEGEILGEIPMKDQGEGQGSNGQGGQGESEDHETGAEAYQLGKLLTERFKLPNIKEKQKKSTVIKYKYELSDKRREDGQILDIEESLYNIVKTNVVLGTIDDVTNVDPSKLIVSPEDLTYWVLSREKYFEPQAMVFFLRDYSGSMTGPPTDLVLTYHLYIYSWLLYQYKEQVKSKFIVHDTAAKEVPDFDIYYRIHTGGGTTVATAFNLVNKIVEENNLAKDYNIYVFYGTDGEDWTPDGKDAIAAMDKMMAYANRIGITIIESPYAGRNNTAVEQYVKKSGILEKNPQLIRLDSLAESEVSQDRIIEGIKKLIS